MIILTGKNTDFKAIWDCNSQSYSVYKSGKFVIRQFRFADVKSYLD